MVSVKKYFTYVADFLSCKNRKKSLEIKFTTNSHSFDSTASDSLGISIEESNCDIENHIGSHTIFRGQNKDSLKSNPVGYINYTIYDLCPSTYNLSYFCVGLYVILGPSLYYVSTFLDTF